MFYLAFVVYGSLLPFELRPAPPDGAWAAFLRLPYLQIGVSHRVDLVANILLYMPLGFLGAGVIRGHRRPRVLRALAAFLVIACIAILVEYTQIFFEPRTVSLNDILAQWFGTVLGIVAWNMGGLRFAKLVRELPQHGLVALRAGLIIYFTAYLGLVLFPFDFVVSMTELEWKLHTDLWGLVLAPEARSNAVRGVLHLLADFLVIVPVGALVALNRFPRHRDAIVTALVFGLGIGLLIEVLQLFMTTGVSQGASVMARGAGAAVGALLVDVALRRARSPVPHWVGPALAVAAVPYAVLLAFVSGWFSGPWVSPEAAAERLQARMFLPFYFHYFVSEFDAMRSVLSVGLMNALLGLGYWLWSRARRHSGTVGGAAFLAAGVAGLLETGKLFAPDQHPDPTNVLVAALAASLGFIAARWAQKTMAEAARSAEQPLADAGRLPAAGREEWVEPAQQRPVPEPGLQGDGVRDVTGSQAGGQPSQIRFALSVVLLAAAAAALIRFPLMQIPLALALVAYAALLWHRPALWLIVIPALLPSLDLATASGWFFVDEFDLFLLVTVAMALLRPVTNAPQVPLPRAGVVLLVLFAVSYAIATLRGLLPLGPLDLNAFANQYSSYETLRVAKGVIWAFLLMPLLRREFVQPARAGWYLTTGMALGLLLTGAWVLHERLVFTGLFDFTTDFRATGAFSGVNTGGSAVEAYLVMALPFALLCLVQGRRGWRVLLGLLALLIGGYALLVTFARGGYAAGAVGLAVAAVGLAVARRSRHRGASSWRLLGGGVAAAAVAGVLVLAAVLGPYMAGRFATTRADFDTRWNHWQTAIGMMDADWATALFGMGVGRFPETYFWKTAKGDRPGTFAFVQENGNRFLRLGAGDALYVRQQVVVQPDTTYRLALDVRSALSGPALNVFLCEQTLLYSLRCETRSIRTGNQGSAWQPIEAVISTDGIGSGRWFARRSVFLGVSHSSGESAIEIDNVRLVSPDSENVVRNGDFQQGFDFWFFAADGHLAWHVKNLWLATLFDQGGLGVLALGLLVGYVVVKLAGGVAAGSRVSAAMVAALLALLAIGVMESPLDFPRISLLFYLLLFAGLVRAGTTMR